MSVPHPIPYQGSKRAIAQRIVSYFPMDTDRLIEPFAGSAAVSLAAAYHGRAKRFLLADINSALIRLWDEIVNRPEEIADAYKALWHAQQGRERKYYDEIRTQFNLVQRPDHFLYLLARCVKASIRYNPNGEFNQSPDNRRKGARPSEMRMRILGASRLLEGRTTLVCSDYREVLRFVTPADVIYMDPPYQGVCIGRDRRYAGSIFFDVKAFIEALDQLNRDQISYLVSYDGRTGDKAFGTILPRFLGLTHLEINVGRSSQATLLGRNAYTFESLYLSPALLARCAVEQAAKEPPPLEYQYPLLTAVND